MSKWLPIALCSFCLFVSSVSALELGLVTGSATGTYYKIGEDLQKLLSEKLTLKAELTLKVSPSAGSLANVLQVYQTRGVDLGIVQSDVLAYIQQLSENQDLQRIARKLKLVFPLFNEEVQVLAARDSNIKSFTDLAGKTVAVGPKDSGTYLTASFFFELMQEKPARALELPYQDALEELKKGTIDALIWVG
jgi:TRAP transporter TAXI family solute receptor